MTSNKTELLVPAGSVDSFRAAIRGGADAIYMGLKQFNARVRANNFSEDQLPAILQEAHKNKVKIYITLNTVIKQKELPRLLDFMAYLEKVGVDAIIVQDWGVFSLARQYFPKLVLHASTQMGNHNSVGVQHAAKCGFQRVVMARELTMTELEHVAQKSVLELEVFIHGALCYSFSGQCFFSSYIGGRGANRGMCSQPCRMAYTDKQEQKYLFNLKDNQQLDNLDGLQKAGIHSLKIEGRMKSADYVFQVASAYRLALDHPEQKAEAEAMLQLDFGREKTGYFLDQNVSEALAENSNTGILMGNVIRAAKSEITFFSAQELQANDRLRIRLLKSNQTVNLKLDDFWEENGRYSLPWTGKERISSGDEIYWIGRRQESFPSRLPKVPAPTVSLAFQQKTKILQQQAFRTKSTSQGSLFIRIDDTDWFPFIRAEEVECIILSLGRKQLEELNFDQKFIQKNKAKLAIELPKFIAEGQIEAWQKAIRKAEENGIQHFFLSHLSQQLLISRSSRFSCNEQVYVYNDAASKFLNSEGAQHFCYSIENDFENLKALQNRQGIVLLHTTPELFYSRMPVKLEQDKNQFKDEFSKTYTKQNKDGITIVTPDRPVNLFQYKNQLLKEGFNHFMFDLKHEVPNPKLIKKIFLNYRSGDPIQPSTIFNFKKGLQ
ncbi:peptidase U32 family protein [Mangrovibacterium diazotrophicum]|uniref:Putative protease n=1 Tax=Mangrovibacterium diazotrophicum TaxID=1261403 RepID=A0A419W3B4_9BACT|nr:peptidase U32 family protein [Mangrovibacterium diazotrophicum]RKD89924.1 putative protease [Mangrovibacterium diazotrophicum]